MLDDRYDEPYDKLWNYYFGSDFTFYIATENPSIDHNENNLDFTLVLVVFSNKLTTTNLSSGLLSSLFSNAKFC